MSIDNPVTNLAAAIAGCLLALLAILPAASASAAEGEACPNAALRTGLSAGLPRCRAYELVSPVGSEPEFYFNSSSETGSELDTMDGAAKEVQAAVGGGRFGYVTPYPPEGSPSDGLYLRLTRGTGGWSSEEMIPPQTASYSVICRSGYVAAYSSELTTEVLGDGVGQPGSDLGQRKNLECGTDDPLLLAGEPQGFQNLFSGERGSGPYQLIDESEAPQGFSPAGAWFQAASDDLSHVVFTEAARLTAQAPPVPNQAAAELSKGAPPLPDLYEWAAGTVSALTVLPDGAPVEGRLANGILPAEEPGCCAGAETFTHAVSADGSRVFFQAKETPQAKEENLYLRLNAEQPQSPLEGGVCVDASRACTVQVDAGADGGESSGGGRFMWATPDGSRVFFADEHPLTGDSTAKPGKPDLYEYDVGAPPGERLSDLTVNAGEAADVLGVSGISDDGSHVYFVAQGKLTAAENSAGAVAVAGQPNVYLAHAGTITFIATLDSTHNVKNIEENDAPDWVARQLTARVTPDGQWLAFNSDRELTGYDNVDVNGRERDDEIFLFNAASGRLVCVSCSPTGAPSVGHAEILPPTTDVLTGLFQAAGYLQRDLSDDGRVFFSTPEPLVEGARDGVSNVYEYDAGVLHLISTGASLEPSYFYDATPDGSDVFVMTAQVLPSGGPAGEYRVYDAREDGGFPAPAARERCSGEEACRAPVVPLSGFVAPATTASLASQNLAPPPVKHEVKGVTVTVKPLTRAQKLTRALKACRKQHPHSKHKRTVCEAQARRSYGPKKAAGKHAAPKGKPGKR